MSKYSKGASKERELIEWLWDHGWPAMRAAGSGGQRYPSPDVMTGRDKRTYMIECKYTDKPRVYLPPEEIRGLKLFGHVSGSTPVVGLREKQDRTWRFVHVDDIPRPGKNYKVSRDLVRDLGVKDEDLFDEEELPRPDDIMGL